MLASTSSARSVATRGAQILTVAALASASIAYAASVPAAGSSPTASGSPSESRLDGGLNAQVIELPAAAAAALARTSQATAASRSAVRSGAGVAGQSVSAPAAAGPVRAVSYGALGVKAVAKPKPKPVVTATAAAGGSASASTVASSAGAAPAAGGSTSTYAAAGAGLGLVPAAAAVYSAVRSTFGITNIGGMRPGDWGDHGTGHAIDVMITSSAQGDAVANYILANAGAFGIKYVIWQQRIWMPSTGSWKLMEDRGSPTQNHMDHVHISVN